MKQLLFVMLISGSLVSCSRYSTNGEQLYLSSKNGPHIHVPAPLTESNISHFYDLPSQEKDARVNIVPPSSLHHHNEGARR